MEVSLYAQALEYLQRELLQLWHVSGQSELYRYKTVNYLFKQDVGSLLATSRHMEACTSSACPAGMQAKWEAWLEGQCESTGFALKHEAKQMPFTPNVSAVISIFCCSHFSMQCAAPSSLPSSTGVTADARKKFHDALHAEQAFQAALTIPLTINGVGNSPSLGRYS